MADHINWMQEVGYWGKLRVNFDILHRWQFYQPQITGNVSFRCYIPCKMFSFFSNFSHCGYIRCWSASFPDSKYEIFCLYFKNEQCYANRRKYCPSTL